MTTGELTGALEETLSLFERSGAPMTTTEVAERLDVGRRSAYDRLDRLVEHGEIRTKKVGANARVWWRPSASPTAAAEDVEGWPAEAELLVDDVFGRVDVGVFVLDADFEVAWVSEAIERFFGIDRSELVGEDKTSLVESAVAPVVADPEAFVDRVRPTYETGAGAERFECRVVPGRGREERWLEHRSQPVDSGPFAGGRVEVYHDVTERKRRERELRENRAQYEAIVETVEDGIYAIDEDDRFVLVNDGFCDLTGYDREELLGSHATLIYDDEVSPVAESKADAVRAGETKSARLEFDILSKSGEAVPCESRFAPFPLGDGSGRCGVVRDVSDRLERETELQRRISQQEVVTELGRRALEDRDLDALLAEASWAVAETLDNDYCKVLDLDEDVDELLLRQGVGWHDGTVGAATVSAVEDDSQAAYTLAADGPVVVENLTTERRFSGPDLLREHDVRSGISTIIGPFDDPWGILGTHDTEAKSFSEHDVNFVQSVANVLASAIARHEDERELVRQRERLAALNSLNEVVRETTDAVISQSTREEIEETVCEHLAESDSYAFAWIGDADTASKTVNVRTEAGVEGYLDDVTISVDPDDERSEGPTGRAFRTGEMQTTQDVSADRRFDPWREHVDRSGFRSSAAIPIVHEDAVYGVLNVYSERPNAFEGEERTVVSQLGEIVGHAIAATERKRALMSDDVVELAFQIPDVFAATGIDGNSSGRVTLDHAIPVQDGGYLLYGTATADAVDTVRAVVDSLGHWDSVAFNDETSDTRFEARLSDPPVLSVVASAGGTVEEAVIDGGDYDMTIYAPPTADVRRIITAVREAYPTAQLLKHRQVARDDEAGRAKYLLSNRLTDRQQTVVEAAYHAGFFEWPRETTGEGVAESLGISPPTFHQHLRKAEGKVFDHLVSTSFPSPGQTPTAAANGSSRTKE